MNLYLLKRNNDNGYDVANGFVIASVDEFMARQLASNKHGDEGAEAWQDFRRSTCERIGSARRGTRPGIILRDFHAG